MPRRLIARRPVDDPLVVQRHTSSRDLGEAYLLVRHLCHDGVAFLAAFMQRPVRPELPFLLAPRHVANAAVLCRFVVDGQRQRHGARVVGREGRGRPVRHVLVHREDGVALAGALVQQLVVVVKRRVRR